MQKKRGPFCPARVHHPVESDSRGHFFTSEPRSVALSVRDDSADVRRVHVQFIVAVILFVVVSGIVDARLPWPRSGKGTNQ